MNKVFTELEALEVCREYQCKIEFRKADSWNQIPAYVKIQLGFHEVVGKDFIEAVNRMSDMYHTSPINHEKLDWWEENKNFFDVRYWRDKAKSE